MPVPATTVGELKEMVALIISNRHTGLGASETRQITHALHFALMEFLRETNSACLHADGTFTTDTSQSDPSTYDLADDFHVMVGESVRQSASPYTPLLFMTQQEYDLSWSRSRGAPGDPTHFMLRRRNAQTGCMTVTLVPEPSSAKTYIYRYVAAPPGIAHSEDAAQIDNRIPLPYRDALVAGAVTYLSRYLNTQSDLAIHAQKWRMALDSARATTDGIIGVPIQRGRFNGRNMGTNQLINPPTNSYSWT